MMRHPIQCSTLSVITGSGTSTTTPTSRLLSDRLQGLNEASMEQQVMPDSAWLAQQVRASGWLLRAPTPLDLSMLLAGTVSPYHIVRLIAYAVCSILAWLGGTAVAHAAPRCHSTQHSV